MLWGDETRTRRANGAIGVAAEANGHAFADIHAATETFSRRGYLRAFAGDCFHLNEHGHCSGADVVWDQLSPRVPTIG